MNPAVYALNQDDQAASSFLMPPFSQLDDASLLEYFSNRTKQYFFPVPDPEETRRDKIDALLKDSFTFNGETHILASPVDWLSNPSPDVEWHILLHKFYYAVGLGMAYQGTGDNRYLDKWVSLVSTWMDQTPPGFIAADVAGRRVQNWIYAYHYFVIGNANSPVDPAFHRRMLQSIVEQVEYLCENLTPARNHRTLELYAIFLAGVAFPEMRNAKHWVEFSIHEIARNMQTDLLADGVHCELSTDYHQLVLKNYLCVRRLAKMNGIPVPPEMDQRLVKALEFSMYVHKPDGDIPSLSDGDSRSFLELLMQGYELYGREDMLYVATSGTKGEPPRKRSALFPDSGYAIVHGGWGERELHYKDEQYLVFDCGPLGAGNHGHFDCLNIELAAFGRSLVVDPGRYTYSEAGDINWRVLFRGTAYHNTVVVDGKNQTRYEPRVIKDKTRHARGSIRHKITGSAPRHEMRTFDTRPGFVYLHGLADSSEYDAIHERRIFFAFNEYWIICDSLCSENLHQYDQIFHLSAQANNQLTIRRERNTLSINSPNLVIAQEDHGSAVNLAIEPGFVSNLYGHKSPAPIVRFRQNSRNAAFHTILHAYESQAPEISIHHLQTTQDGMLAEEAHTLQIHTGAGQASTCDYLLCSRNGSGDWQFGPYRFQGSYLLMRKNAYGEMIQAHSNPGGRLWEAGLPVNLLNSDH